MKKTVDRELRRLFQIFSASRVRESRFQRREKRALYLFLPVLEDKGIFMRFALLVGKYQQVAFSDG